MKIFFVFGPNMKRFFDMNKRNVGAIPFVVAPEGGRHATFDDNEAQ